MSNQNQVLQPDVINQQISNLLLGYPDLANDEQLRADMIEGATSAFEYVEQQLKTAAEKKSFLKGLEDYIKTLRERAEIIEHQVEVHRHMIRKVMETAQLTSLKLSVASVSIATGRPRVIIKDLHSLPEDCRRIIVEPNKVAIAAKFQAGESVPGAELSNGEPYLSVRFK